MGIEACCGAADLAEELATQWQLPIQLAHPGYVNRMKQSPDKTDFGDAQLLADLARVNYLPAVWLAPRTTRNFVVWCGTGASCPSTQRHQASYSGDTSGKPFEVPPCRAWTKAWYTWLTSEAELSESDRWVLDDHLEELVSLSGRIAAVEARIQLHVTDDPVVARLREQRGVGLITAVTIRAESAASIVSARENSWLGFAASRHAMPAAVHVRRMPG